MSQVPYWDEALPPAILTEFCDPQTGKRIDTLPGKQIDGLWALFAGIDTHWRLGLPTDLLRSRWLDMIEARRAEAPDYTAEYLNAAAVHESLVGALGKDAAIARFYGETKVLKADEASTRLGHAKFFVGNDFIRCFVACGGFRGFVPKARNYTGFMGGSRFREWPPVRTGSRT